MQVPHIVEEIMPHAQDEKESNLGQTHKEMKGKKLRHKYIELNGPYTDLNALYKEEVKPLTQKNEGKSSYPICEIIYRGGNRKRKLRCMHAQRIGKRKLCRMHA